MTFFPAIDVSNVNSDLALAAADDCGPVAAESSGDGIMIFFSTAQLRDQASAEITRALPGALVVPREVDDEDWARRSQENLGPIVVGRVTVKPRPGLQSSVGRRAPGPTSPSPDSLEIVIQPSMGFGTGHHATTRLCLGALQRLDLGGCFVLDVGTGSGVLAIAARALGADRALGVDYDPDAIQSASENLPLNPGLDRIAFEVCDINREPLPSADVVTANLTGALLCRVAPTLIATLRPGGHLIVSGVLAPERDDVRSAFAPLALDWESGEDEWVGFGFNHFIRDTV